MELRVDRLLEQLRHREEEILAAIDADPLLIRRVSGDLVLANASKKLFSPTQPHHLYAKGIIYRREPYRLVSLPLLKIYNVGERNITPRDLHSLTQEPDVRLRFLHKMDGSLLQVFRHGSEIFFTTRGMIEGATPFGERDEDELPHFDYLAVARQMAQRQYPRLFDLVEGLTLLFELIHPEARVITNYGDRTELILLSAFDRTGYRYLDYGELTEVAERYGLTRVDLFAPQGHDLTAQIESLVASLRGTDQEGSVLCFERPGQVIYRVKVKTPDYLHLLRVMAFCTYERTVEMIDNWGITSWECLETLLKEQGNDRVPEEVLDIYREYYERFVAYLADLDRIRLWAERERDRVDAQIGGRAGWEPGEYRRAFAQAVACLPHKALLFAALDGKLDTARLRKMVPTPEKAATIPG
jgi:hypothetical protein